MEQTKIYKKSETNATRAGAGADLLGFKAGVDDGDQFEARGGRGGRGRGDRAQRPERPQTQRTGGRRGGKIVVDDNEFPAL